MIASTISVIVLTGLVSSVAMLSKTTHIAITESNATLENLTILRQLERDLRGVANVITKDAQSFQFETTDPFGNTVELLYSYDNVNQTLTRQNITDNTTEIILSSTEGLSKVSFTYYTQMGVIANTPADANAVKISIERSLSTHATVANLSKSVDVSMIMFRNKTYDFSNT